MPRNNTAAAENPVKKTGDLVTVGLKLPNGLRLQLQKKDTVRYATRDGGIKEMEEWHPDYEQAVYVLYGNKVAHGEQPRCLIVNGFAMTPNIPADFVELWMEQNKQLDIVKNGLLIVHKRTDSARDDAKDRAGLKSGLEPIQRDVRGNVKDDRIPKRRDRAGNLVDAIETGDEQPKSAAVEAAA